MAGVVGSMYDLFYNWPHPSEPSDAAQPRQQAVGDALVTAYGTPQEDPSFWDSVSPINFVSDTSAWIQIDQDVNDSQVPKLFSDHLDAVLQAAGRNVEYDLYPGDDHQFIANRAAILANTVAFFRAHL